MSKLKNEDSPNNASQLETVRILFQCPICAKSAYLTINSKAFLNTDNLTTISVPKNIICPHHFQVFVDKNYKVRGYQKVDFQIKKNRSQQICKESISNKPTKESIRDYKSTKEISFDQFKFENNELSYNPNTPKSKNNIPKIPLKELYEEFWEFIPDDNKTFEVYIEKDKRRIHYVY